MYCISPSTSISGSSISASRPSMISVEVVRRDVGGHAHGDAGRTVDQQVREPRRHDRRFVFLLVVVGLEVDRFLVDVGHQLVGQARHARLGVTHGRGGVAVDRTEVALPVHQQVAQRERLRHAHEGVVHRLVAVRVVFADDVADDAGRLVVGLVAVAPSSFIANRTRRWTGFRPSRTSGSARPTITLMA